MRLHAEDDAITAQNDAIWGLIAPFLANQIARITIDFKMSIIKLFIEQIALKAVKSFCERTKYCSAKSKLFSLSILVSVS